MLVCQRWQGLNIYEVVVPHVKIHCVYPCLTLEFNTKICIFWYSFKFNNRLKISSALYSLSVPTRKAKVFTAAMLDNHVPCKHIQTKLCVSARLLQRGSGLFSSVSSRFQEKTWQGTLPVSLTAKLFLRTMCKILV